MAINITPVCDSHTYVDFNIFLPSLTELTIVHQLKPNTPFNVNLWASCQGETCQIDVSEGNVKFNCLDLVCWSLLERLALIAS